MQEHMTKKGFTLVEVIVSVGILAVISILFVSVFSKMVEVNMANKKMNAASLSGASNITTGNYECGESIGALSFDEMTFNVQPKMCRPNSGKKFNLFRIVDEPTGEGNE